MNDICKENQNLFPDVDASICETLDQPRVLWWNCYEAQISGTRGLKHPNACVSSIPSTLRLIKEAI